MTALARVFRTEPLELALADGVNAPAEDAALRALTVTCTGALTADAHLVLPLREGVHWIVVNATSGGYAVIVRGPTGSSATVPHPSACEVVCDGDGFRLVGSSGSSAGGYTLTTGAFTVPGVSSSVTVDVGSSDWMAVGQAVYVAGAGYYRVASKADSLSTSLTNLGWTGNASPSTVVATAKLVTSAGELGATGPAGPAGSSATAEPVEVLAKTASYALTTADAGKLVKFTFDDAADVYATLPDLLLAVPPEAVNKRYYVANDTASGRNLVVQIPADNYVLEGGYDDHVLEPGDSIAVLGTGAAYRVFAHNQPNSTLWRDTPYENAPALTFPPARRRAVWVVGSAGLSEVNDQSSVILPNSARDDVADGDEVTVVVEGNVPAPGDRWISVAGEYGAGITSDVIVGDPSGIGTYAGAHGTQYAATLREPGAMMTLRCDKAGGRWVIVSRTPEVGVLFKQTGMESLDCSPPRTGQSGETVRSYAANGVVSYRSATNAFETAATLTSLPASSVATVIATADAIQSAASAETASYTPRVARFLVAADGTTHTQLGATKANAADDWEGADAVSEGWDFTIDNAASGAPRLRVKGPAAAARWTLNVNVTVRTLGVHGSEAS